LNTTVALIGVIGFAIVGPLVLAAVIAGVMAWLSRQVSAGVAPVPEAPVRKPAPTAKPAPPASAAPTRPEPVPATVAEVEPTFTEAASLEKEATHQRVVPVWLVAVYVLIIAWALWYIGTQVVPFFKPVTASITGAQIAPTAAPAATPAPSASQPAASGKGDTANGEKLFASNGCAACHSFKEGEKIIGPSLYHIGQTAASHVKGGDYQGHAKTAEDYVRESIVEPNVYIVPGFSAGIMLQDFGAKLNAQNIDDLVAFLMTK
jgi:cytochrome c2